jgi:hypothetical protein
LAFKAEQAIAIAEIGFLWRAWLIMAGVSMQVNDYTSAARLDLKAASSARYP